MWRWIIIIVVIAGIAGTWVAVTASQPVETAAARRGAISGWIQERAMTRLPKTYRVSMPITGRIRPIELTEGDVVTAGQVVARIEQADLDTAVVMAEARVRRLEASIIENNDRRLEDSTIVELDSFLESVDRSVDASLAETEASKAREDYRVFDHERKKVALANNAASQREVEESQLAEIESRVDYRTDVLQLRALEAIRRAVQIWPLQVTQMIEKKALKEAVLAQELVEARAAHTQAMRDRRRGEITAPVSGIVLERLVANERVLPAGQPLLEIGRLAELEVEVEVLSQDAVDIAAGNLVEIDVPTVRHAPLTGRVSRLEPRGFTKVSSLGVEQQRVLVIVAFDPGVLDQFSAEGFTLGVGYRLQVRIITDTHENAVVVPRSALFRGVGDRWQVFVVTGDRARRVDVQIGLLNDHDVEIVSGVNASETVVVAPETDLDDGARVKPRP